MAQGQLAFLVLAAFILLFGPSPTAATFTNYIIKQHSLPYSPTNTLLDTNCTEIHRPYLNIRECPTTTIIFILSLKTAFTIEFLDQAPSLAQKIATNTLNDQRQHLIAIQRSSIVLLLKVNNQGYQVKSFFPTYVGGAHIENLFFWSDFLILQEANSCTFFAERANVLLSVMDKEFVEFWPFDLVTSPTKRCSKQTFAVIPSNNQLLLLDFEFQTLTSKTPIYNEKTRRFQFRSGWIHHLNFFLFGNLENLESLVLKQDTCSKFLTIYNVKTSVANVVSLETFYFVKNFTVEGGNYGFMNDPSGSSICEAEGNSITPFYIIAPGEANSVKVTSVFLLSKFSPSAVDILVSEQTRALPIGVSVSNVAIGYDIFRQTFFVGIVSDNIPVESKSAVVMDLNETASNYASENFNFDLKMESPGAFPCNSPWEVAQGLSQQRNLAYPRRNDSQISACVFQQLEQYCKANSNSTSQHANFCRQCDENRETCRRSCIGQYYERSCILLNGAIVYAISEPKCAPPTQNTWTMSDITVFSIRRESSDEISCHYALPAFNSAWIVARMNNHDPDLANTLQIKFLTFSSETHLISTTNLSYVLGDVSNSRSYLIPTSKANYASFELTNSKSYSIDFLYMTSSTVLSNFLDQLGCLSCLTPNFYQRQIVQPTTTNGTADASIRSPHLYKISNSSTSYSRRMLEPFPSKNSQCKSITGMSRSKFYLNNYTYSYWFACPAPVETGFCHKIHNESAGAYSMTLNPDFLIQSCKLHFSIEHQYAIQVHFHLLPHEELWLTFSRNSIRFNHTYKSPQTLSSRHVEEFKSFTVSFYTSNPEFSLASGGPKFTIVYKDIDEGLSVMFLILKLLVFILLIVNIIFYYLRRRLMLEDTDFEDEYDDGPLPPPSPYQLIEYKDYHEKQLVLSKEKITSLLNAGFQIDNVGTVTETGESDCMICLDVLNEREYQIFLCGRHFVHVDCFDAWVSKMIETSNDQLCPLRCQSILHCPGGSAQKPGKFEISFCRLLIFILIESSMANQTIVSTSTAENIEKKVPEMSFEIEIKDPSSKDC